MRDFMYDVSIRTISSRDCFRGGNLHAYWGISARYHRWSFRHHKCRTRTLCRRPGGAFEAEGAGTVVGLGWSALFFSLLGFVGAALAMAKPVLSAVIMLVAAIAVAISISLFAVIATPLFLIAALLVFLDRNTRQEEISIQTTQR